jgi:hypothetical protein
LSPPPPARAAAEAPGIAVALGLERGLGRERRAQLRLRLLELALDLVQPLVLPGGLRALVGELPAGGFEIPGQLPRPRLRVPELATVRRRGRAGFLRRIG